jgi:photosystem II stability/assembly factor-like uncharacterized protein
MTNQQFDQLQAQDMIYAMARTGDLSFVARASGLYRSTNGGASWQPAYQTIDIDVEQPLVTTAAAAHGQMVFAGVRGAILRSSNGGTDWFSAVLPPPAPLVSVLATSPNFEEDGHVVAGTAEDGVFVSTDRGLRWLPWNFGLLDLNVYAIAYSPTFTSDQTIYIGTESGIFRSKNGGRAWRPLPFPMDAAPVISLCFAPGDPADRRLLAGTEAHGLYASDDDGATWSHILPDLVSGAVNAIMGGPDVADLSLLLDNELLVSKDGGMSWQASDMTFPAEAQPIAMLPEHAKWPVSIGFSDGSIVSVAGSAIRRDG